MKELCAICGCKLNREPGVYARDSVLGRSHATKHHYVAERFFGRSANQKGKKRTPIFNMKCPGDLEGKTVVLCYDCHEELIQNPVFLSKDIEKFKKLVKFRKLAENEKPEDKKKLAGRIELLNEVIEAGIEKLLKKEIRKHRVDGA